MIKSKVSFVAFVFLFQNSVTVWMTLVSSSAEYFSLLWRSGERKSSYRVIPLQMQIYLFIYLCFNSGGIYRQPWSLCHFSFLLSFCSLGYHQRCQYLLIYHCVEGKRGKDEFLRVCSCNSHEELDRKASIQ